MQTSGRRNFFSGSLIRDRMSTLRASISLETASPVRIIAFQQGMPLMHARGSDCRLAFIEDSGLLRSKTTHQSIFLGIFIPVSYLYI